jgi:uncharacterized protein (DUF934 family)
MPPFDDGQDLASRSPPPLWGRDRVEGKPDLRSEGVPPPLSPPHKGEGDRLARAASGEPQPDGPIWRGTAFFTDGWAKAADDAPLPDAPVILSKTRWLAERDRLAGRNAPLGLRLEPGETADDIADDLGRFALIALSFPKFADGRAFSTATLLRDKHGFTGELRAVGAVLSDQIPYMRRVGFDTLEVAHAPTRRALAEGRIPEVTLHYQPAAAHEAPAGTRPWLRRGPGWG